MNLEALRLQSQIYAAPQAVQAVQTMPAIAAPVFAPAMQQSPATDLIARRKSLLEDIGENFGSFAEIKRIINLPIMWPLTPEEVDAVSRKMLLAEAYDSGFRLFDTQAAAMVEYFAAGGLFGPIGVGWGKTLISLMIANAAYQSGMRKMCLFIPSQLFKQLTLTDIPWARTKIPITYPIIPLGGKSLAERRQWCQSGQKGLYVLPYSLLSTKDGQESLEAIDPEIIISDEAHNLANESAARTSRIKQFNKKKNPRWVALSGTITKKTVDDYHHLIRWALGENNPLPNAPVLAREWGVVLNAAATDGACYVSDSMTGPLKPLIEWARKNFPGQEFTEDVAGYRLAFQARCRSAPGYVSSGEKRISTKLTLSNHPVPDYKNQPDWEKLHNLMVRITDMWITPNGDEIDHAIHQYKWLYELTSGFYNQLTWPDEEEYAHRKSISKQESEYLLEAAKEHHAAGQTYTSMLHKWLDKNQIMGCDTPFLVGGEMSRSGAEVVGHELYTTWRAYKDLEFEGCPERDSLAVRVCDYKIRAMLGWASLLPRGEGALVWVFNQEMGKWAYEYLKNSGYDCHHCPAGNQANHDLAPSNLPLIQDKIVIASITAHGQGKNLQPFQHQYVLQWPRQASVAEQMLGRTHRNGQLSEHLTAITNATTAFDRLVFSACVNDALYIQQTTGNGQKVIYCDYDPTPVTFPSHVLQARGMQVSILTSEQRDLMRGKFGKESVDKSKDLS